MKKERLKCVALIILIIVFIGSIICFLFSDCFSSNEASIIGGGLSAVATALLGIVAIWQNIRYKELSDSYNDLITMPELFKADALKDILKATSQAQLNHFYYYAKSDNHSQKIGCGSFVIMNGPILNLYVESVTYDKKVIEMEPISRSLISKDSCVDISLFIPKEDNEYMGNYKMVLVYENIYGVKYKKDVHFVYTNHLCNNWKLDRATRYK